MSTQLELSIAEQTPADMTVFENVPTAQIYAELRRRAQRKDNRKIGFPADVMPHIQSFAKCDQEHFLVVALDGSQSVIGKPHVASIGLVNRTLVHPREVFRPAIQANAAAIIVAHNHPSGNVTPSPEDREVTQKLRQAGKVLGISVLDHLVFTTDGYYSFLESNEMDTPVTGV